MKVAINISPLKTGHKLRGIGYYTENLLNCLKKDRELEILEFTKLSDIKNVDIVHYPWFDFYFHTLPINKKYKTIVTIHDVIPLIYPLHYPVGMKGKVNFFMQKIALRNIEAVITDSKTSSEDLIRKLNLKNQKVFYIPLAADKDFKRFPDTKYIQIKRKYQLPETFLLYVGDANWVKNLPFLINGFFKLIQKSEFKELKLALIGGVFLKNVENIDHSELKSLKEVNRLIKQYKLETKIIRPGSLDKEELIGFYNLSTVYIQPSIYEGFGLPILQAFSCGIPVIASNAGSLREVGGDAAVYFDPNNISQFVNTIQEVLINKSLQKKLSDLGLKRSLNFSWEKVARETKQAYYEVINNI